MSTRKTCFKVNNVVEMLRELFTEIWVNSTKVKLTVCQRSVTLRTHLIRVTVTTSSHLTNLVTEVFVICWKGMQNRKQENLVSLYF